MKNKLSLKRETVRALRFTTGIKTGYNSVNDCHTYVDCTTNAPTSMCSNYCTVACIPDGGGGARGGGNRGHLPI
jgi:hypothetical protein